MKEKKIVYLLAIVVVCLIAFTTESKAQNDAQVAKDKMTLADSWDDVIRTVDTTPTITTNQVTVSTQATPLNRPNTRDNVEITQLPNTFTANVKKANKPPMKPNVTTNVSINQQAIENVKANAALNRVIPTQQEIRNLILEKKSGN